MQGAVNLGAAIEQEATMHIHPNNSLQLASLGAGREEAQEIAAKRAAEVRRKLSTASRSLDLSDPESPSPATRVDGRYYKDEERSGDQRPGEEDGFGRLFSAKA